MSKALSIRVSDELALKLSEIAKETERPKSFHVQKALKSLICRLLMIVCMIPLIRLFPLRT